MREPRQVLERSVEKVLSALRTAGTQRARRLEEELRRAAELEREVRLLNAARIARLERVRVLRDGLRELAQLLAQEEKLFERDRATIAKVPEPTAERAYDALELGRILREYADTQEHASFLLDALDADLDRCTAWKDRHGRGAPPRARGGPVSQRRLR